jgi:hypothetical protein
MTGCSEIECLTFQNQVVSEEARTTDASAEKSTVRTGSFGMVFWKRLAKPSERPWSARPWANKQRKVTITPENNNLPEGWLARFFGGLPSGWERFSGRVMKQFTYGKTARKP